MIKSKPESLVTVYILSEFLQKNNKIKIDSKITIKPEYGKI